MERVGGRWEKMEGHCSTGQSPQWVVVPMEEEEGEEEEDEGEGEEEKKKKNTNIQDLRTVECHIRNSIQKCNSHV